MKEIPLWDETMPFADTERNTLPEKVEYNSDGVLALINVSHPSITCFPISGTDRHPAVLVCPGGGYELLAWDREGTDICAMLNAAGFTAFLLKYRCTQQRAAAHADAARAMRLIRINAEKFCIDPAKIGIIGFSAGAHLAATISAPANPVPYEPQVPVDAISYRPDYTALIYPAYLADETTLQLKREFKVTENTPPTFLVQAENDWVHVEMSISWYLALKKKNVSVEMHLYPEGNHGYGLVRTGKPISNWCCLACDWFRRQTGML